MINFNIPKKRIVIVSASMVLIISVITVTVACLNMSKKRPDDDGAVDVLADVDNTSASNTLNTTEEPVTTRKPETTTAATVPTDESGMVYQRLGGGECMVIAIGTCKEDEIEIPQKSPDGLTVTAIATGAFEGCDNIKSIKIPSTVKSIGTGAFAGCRSLSCFYVDSTNTEFCVVGNVLFSKDKTELICYPAMRVGNSYLLSTNVTKISAYAFDSVSTLKKLLYRGTINQYLDITVGTGNSIFLNMPIEFNYNAQK